VLVRDAQFPSVPEITQRAHQWNAHSLDQIAGTQEERGALQDGEKAPGIQSPGGLERVTNCVVNGGWGLGLLLGCGAADGGSQILGDNPQQVRVRERRELADAVTRFGCSTQ
jgi:hypothetical protein